MVTLCASEKLSLIQIELYDLYQCFKIIPKNDTQILKKYTLLFHKIKEYFILDDFTYFQKQHIIDLVETIFKNDLQKIVFRNWENWVIMFQQFCDFYMLFQTLVEHIFEKTKSSTYKNIFLYVEPLWKKYDFEIEQGMQTDFQFFIFEKLTWMNQPSFYWKDKQNLWGHHYICDMLWKYRHQLEFKKNQSIFAWIGFYETQKQKCLTLEPQHYKTIIQDNLLNWCLKDIQKELELTFEKYFFQVGEIYEWMKCNEQSFIIFQNLWKSYCIKTCFDFKNWKAVSEWIETMEQFQKVNFNDDLILKEIFIHFVQNQISDSWVDEWIQNLHQQLQNFQIPNEFIILFQYIEQKDIFLKKYIGYFQQRLLQNKFDLNCEQQMIAVFKNTMDLSYTHRMENMILDVFSGNVPLEGNQKHCNFKILPFHAWKCLYSEEKLNLPFPLHDQYVTFEKEWKSENPLKKLTLCYEYGNVELEWMVQNKIYYITLSLLQFICIELFSKQNWMTIEQCSHILHVSLESIEKVFICLCKSGLILEEKNYQKYTLNPGLLSSSTIHVENEIEISNPIQKNSFQKSNPHVEMDRTWMIDPAIIRIMKSQKTCDHFLLMDQVQKACEKYFIPSVALIKTRIEILIEKEFIERNDHDRNIYIYLP